MPSSGTCLTLSWLYGSGCDFILQTDMKAFTSIETSFSQLGPEQNVLISCDVQLS